MPHVKMAVSMFGAKAVARNPSIQREPAKTKAVRQLCLSITALAKGPSTEHIYMKQSEYAEMVVIRLSLYHEIKHSEHWSGVAQRLAGLTSIVWRPVKREFEPSMAPGGLLGQNRIP